MRGLYICATMLTLALFGALEVWNVEPTPERVTTTEEKPHTRNRRHLPTDNHKMTTFPGLSGTVDVRPMGLKQCVTVRMRGKDQDFSVPEMVEFLKEARCDLGDATLFKEPSHFQVGLGFVHDKETQLGIDFSASAKEEWQLSAFLEFLLLAYNVLQKFSLACPAVKASPKAATLHQGEPLVSVPWVYVPALKSTEVCGPYMNGGNCMLTDMSIFGWINEFKIDQNKPLFTKVYGLAENDSASQSSNSLWKGDRANTTAKLSGTEQITGSRDHQLMRASADAVVLLRYSSCVKEEENKSMLDELVAEAHFPVHNWQLDVWRGLGLTVPVHDAPHHHDGAEGEEAEKMEVEHLKFGVCVLRNHEMTATETEIIHNVLARHEQVEVKLDPTKWSAATQIDRMRMVSGCHLLVSTHGEDMNHVLLMDPGQFVIELFHETHRTHSHHLNRFARMSQIMGHRYEAFYGNHDVSQPTDILTMDKSNGPDMTAFEATIEKFLQEAIEETLVVY